MSDYALMRKMHDLLKEAESYIEVAEQRSTDPFFSDELNAIKWQIRDVLKEAEGC